MKKVLLIAFMAIFSSGVFAGVKEEIKKNKDDLSAKNVENKGLFSKKPTQCFTLSCKTQCGYLRYRVVSFAELAIMQAALEEYWCGWQLEA